MWLRGITKALFTLLGNKLRKEFDGIDSHPRVSTSIKSVLCAANKEFSLCANYPKGYGELFREYIETNNPGELILHVGRALGSHQYLAVKGAEAVYTNRPY